MRKRKIRPPKVEMDFTDLNLTAYGGSSILAETARRYGLFELLADAVRSRLQTRPRPFLPPRRRWPTAWSISS